MPVDPHAFIAEHKGKEIDGQLQTVVILSLLTSVSELLDGTQMRVRLMLDEHHHQFINLVIIEALICRGVH